MYAINVLWSDATCYEVVRKVSDKTLEVRRMKQEIVNKQQIGETFKPGGFIGHFDDSIQQWKFESNPEAPVERIRLTKKGWHGSQGKFVLSETPWARYDYNF